MEPVELDELIDRAWGAVAKAEDGDCSEADAEAGLGRLFAAARRAGMLSERERITEVLTDLGCGCPTRPVGGLHYPSCPVQIARSIRVAADAPGGEDRS